MSYAMLLEEYNAEQELASVTYASIAENMQALVEFVRQDVTVDLTLSLESVENIDAIKEEAEAAKATFLTKLKDKLVAWANKIVEEAKKIAKKAAIAAANMGNGAMKNLISKKAVTKKAIKVKDFKLDNGKTKEVINKLSAIATMDAEEKKDSSKVAAAVSAAFEDLEKFETNEVDEKAGQSVKNLYDLYVDKYITRIDYHKISSTIDKAAANAKKLAKAIEAGKQEGDASEVRERATTLMKAGTTLLTFAFQNISLGVANAAKIALACGAAKEKKEEEKKEEK